MCIMLSIICLQDIDIDNHYKNYSSHVRKSLEAWSASKIDLGLVCTLLFFFWQ